MPRSSLSAPAPTTRYLLLVADPDKAIEENDEKTLGDLGANNVFAYKVITHFAWLVHGFNPNPLDYSGFQSKYQEGGAYNLRTKEALESTGEFAEVRPINWPSSDGWLESFAVTLLKLLPQPVVINPISNLVLDQILRDGLSTARLRSYQASNELQREIRQKVLGSIGLLKDDDAIETTVTLIGHSRGGEVAARSLRNLRVMLDSLGVKSQVVVLDGFGTDWPGLGATLGVDHPFPIGRSGDLNVRVSHGLGGLPQLVRDVLGYIVGGQIPVDVLPDDTKFVGSETWRAPERSPMRNLLFSNSSHTSITGEFFNEPIESYLTALTSTGSPEGPGYQDIPQSSGISGGDAQSLSILLNDFVLRTQGIEANSPFWDLIFDGLNAPTSWLRMHWTISNVELLPVEHKFRLQNESRMSQPISVLAGGTVLRIQDGILQQAQDATSTIQISFNGHVVDSQIWSGPATFDTLTLSIPNDSASYEIADFEISFQSTDPNAQLLIESMKLGEEQPALSATTVVANGSASLEVVNAGEIPLSRFSYFRESNGVSGLQIGEGGDEKLQFTNGILNLAGGSVPGVIMASYIPPGRTEPAYLDVIVQNQFRTNFVNKLDTNADGVVSPIDALLVINFLNTKIPGYSRVPDRLIDVSSDGEVSPLDALLVINKLNARSREGEGERDSLKQLRSEGEQFVADFWLDNELVEDIRQARRSASTNSYLRVGKSLARRGR